MGVIVEDRVRVSYPPAARLNGGGGPTGVGPNGRRFLSLHENAPPPESTAIWVGIATIVMMFAALTSAMIVRQGASTDWHHFDLPTILYFNTFILLGSSLTLEMFVRGFKRRYSDPLGHRTAPALWLYITLALGLVFVIGQYVAWYQLNSEGLYLASNPSHSFFYVLTGAHVLHVLGGIGGLVYIIGKVRKFTLQSSTMGVATKYWHFMDLLWLYLLGLLWLKL